MGASAVTRSTLDSKRAQWLREKCRKSGKWETGNEQTEITFQLHGILHFASYTEKIILVLREVYF